MIWSAKRLKKLMKLLLQVQLVKERKILQLNMIKELLQLLFTWVEMNQAQMVNKLINAWINQMKAIIWAFMISNTTTRKKLRNKF